MSSEINVTLDKAKDFLVLGNLKGITATKPKPLFERGYMILLNINGQDYPLLGSDTGKPRYYRNLNNVMKTVEEIGLKEFTVKA